MFDFVAKAQAQARTAVPDVAPEAHGAFPPFASETFASQLLWFAVAFGLLYYVMSRFALPRVAAIMESRSQRIAADLAEAERLRAESEAAGAAYEKSLGDARAKAKAIAQEMREALTALELLVAVLQAYVFATLTAIYLNDALHPGH